MGKRGSVKGESIGDQLVHEPVQVTLAINGRIDHRGTEAAKAQAYELANRTPTQRGKLLTH